MCECVSQVSRTPSWLLALATDARSWSGDPEDMPTNGVGGIDTIRARHVGACVDQLRTDLDILLDTVKNMSAQVACAVLSDGSKVRSDAALGILIGELLIRGHDIARTLRLPWSIPPDSVPLVARGRHQVLPRWLDTGRAAATHGPPTRSGCAAPTSGICTSSPTGNWPSIRASRGRRRAHADRSGDRAAPDVL